MEKSEFIVNNDISIVADKIWWDYEQTDSENSGANAGNVFVRDVLPRRIKIGYKFHKVIGEELARKILKIRGMDSCQVKHYDLETGTFKTRTMYPVSDNIIAEYELGKNNDIVCEEFELRFTQMIPDKK